jgi:hypothetical protein
MTKFAAASITVKSHRAAALFAIDDPADVQATRIASGGSSIFGCVPFR